MSPAKTYALAVYEYAGSAAAARVIVADLRGFWEQCRSSEKLMAAVSRPGTPALSREKIVIEIAKAMGLGTVATRVIGLLSARGRMTIVPQLISELGKLVDAADGVSVGALFAAVELSDNELSRLSSAISRRAGTRVRLEQTLEPALLGGFVVTVDGKTYDASLKSQLNRFKNELI